MNTESLNRKKNRPLLSVIVPLYNDKSYINQCIDSILINKSEEIEVVISDDHSDDGSVDICKSYKKTIQIKNLI